MKCTSTLLCFVALVSPGLTQVNLATAAAYGALAVSGITNTGPTVIGGDIGTTGAEITGFPPGVFSGTSMTGTAPVDQARADGLDAFNAAMNIPGGIDSTANSELGGLTLQAGVYRYTSGVSLTGILTLDGGGNADASWVFQITSTLITASASSIVLTNGASACNVYWAVGSSATLGAASEFVGNILAESSISLTTGATVNGGLYAGAAITLEDNVVTPGNCGPVTVSSTTSATSTTSTSVPSTTSTILTTSTSTSATSSKSTLTSTTSLTSTSQTTTSITPTTKPTTTSTVKTTTTCPTLTATLTSTIFSCSATSSTLPTTKSSSSTVKTTLSTVKSSSTSVYKPTTSSKTTSIKTTSTPVYGYFPRDATNDKCTTATSTVTAFVTSCTSTASTTSIKASTTKTSISITPTSTKASSTSTTPESSVCIIYAPTTTTPKPTSTVETKTTLTKATSTSAKGYGGY